jgi:hypothetical protein
MVLLDTSIAHHRPRKARGDIFAWCLLVPNNDVIYMPRKSAPPDFAFTDPWVSYNLPYLFGVAWCLIRESDADSLADITLAQASSSLQAFIIEIH